MAFRTENGKVILLPLSDQQLRRLSEAQFGSMRPMRRVDKAKMRQGESSPNEPHTSPPQPRGLEYEEEISQPLTVLQLSRGTA